MKKVIFLSLLIYIQALQSQPLVIDEDKASVNFLFLDDDVDGTLSEFKFTGNLDLDSPETSTISGTVASETIDTDNWLRNRHLRRKYFKAEEFPVIRFKSDSISVTDDSLIAEGILTIKGISKTVQFSFRSQNDILIGKASINASDFDIYIHDEAERNKVTITIQLPYIKG